MSQPSISSHFVYNCCVLLELYENLEKVGSSVKHHIVEGMRNMWNQLNELARAHATPTAGMTKEEEEQEIAQGDIDRQTIIYLFNQEYRTHP